MTDEHGGNGSIGSGGGHETNTHTARWQLIVSAAAVGIVIGGAVLSLLLNVNTLSISAARLSARVVNLESTVTETQNQRLALQSEVASISGDLVEIETQFCSEDAMRNLMHANDLRDLAVLWHKVLGDELPTGNAYYPRVGKCDSGGK